MLGSGACVPQSSSHTTTMSARFLFDSELNSALERIFREAKTQLILISPYIKLHDRLQSILRTKLNDDALLIQVVFGKNEEEPQKSMSREQMDFFMQFRNVEIRHERRLHAKYYTNDTEAIITSMNLYSFSQDNNIESGVLTSVSSLSGIANQLTGSEDLDKRALKYFGQVADQAELIYKKEPEYEKVMFGLSKKYLSSKVTMDKVNDFLARRATPHRSKPTPTSISSLEPVSISHPPKVTLAKDQGYCIRTGIAIPFNVKRPLSDEAYKSWSRYKDENYAEKYCHFSGEPSGGVSSFAKPILKKNWTRAKTTYHF